MAISSQVIVIAGAGDLGKYACEELLRDERYNLLVLSRKVNDYITINVLGTTQPDF
jgi:saccharopine dehydrogenase-like NADP-dependent oxidoreductase